jgi:hypothetical protein
MSSPLSVLSGSLRGGNDIDRIDDAEAGFGLQDASFSRQSVTQQALTTL